MPLKEVFLQSLLVPRRQVRLRFDSFQSDDQSRGENLLREKISFERCFKIFRLIFIQVEAAR